MKKYMHVKEICPTVIMQSDLIKRLNMQLHILLEHAYSYMVKLRIIDPVGFAIKQRNKRVEKSFFLHLHTYLKMNNQDLQINHGSAVVSMAFDCLHAMGELVNGANTLT